LPSTGSSYTKFKTFFYTINYISNIQQIEHFYQLEKLIYLMIFTRNIF
jgi:hypothetical protein